MRFLGVDAASSYLGLAVLELDRGFASQMPKLLSFRLVQGKGGTKYGRFVSIDRQVTSFCQEWVPDEAAFEKGFAGHAGQNFQISAMVTAEARGAAMLSVARCSVPISEYHQATIKKTATGSGKTKKAQVEAYIRALFGIDGILQEDVADAIAVALTHIRHREE